MKSKYLGPIFLFLVVVGGCGKEPPKQAPAHSPEVRTIPVGKGPDAMFLTPDQKFLLVANVEATTVSVIDTRTDSVIKTLPNIQYPWGFTRRGNSQTVAVSGNGKQISLIDLETLEVIKQKNFDFNLGGITSSSDGNFYFVVGTETERVYKIDSHDLRILDQYKTGKGPDGIGISKNNETIFVTNAVDGTISVIHLNTKKSNVIQVGGKPELVHYNHDHSKLFISNFKLNKIHIVDTETGKTVNEIAGVESPEEAVLSQSEQYLFVASFSTNKVVVYDAVTLTKIDQEYSTGNKPIGIVPARNDTKLYVSNYGDNSVTAISGLQNDF
jgi:YVTN family beta-propeller protein